MMMIEMLSDFKTRIRYLGKFKWRNSSKGFQDISAKYAVLNSHARGIKSGRSVISQYVACRNDYMVLFHQAMGKLVVARGF